MTTKINTCPHCGLDYVMHGEADLPDPCQCINKLAEHYAGDSERAQVFRSAFEGGNLLDPSVPMVLDRDHPDYKPCTWNQWFGDVLRTDYAEEAKDE